MIIERSGTNVGMIWDSWEKKMIIQYTNVRLELTVSYLGFVGEEDDHFPQIPSTYIRGTAPNNIVCLVTVTSPCNTPS
jgi:hypothetical protein